VSGSLRGALYPDAGAPRLAPLRSRLSAALIDALVVAMFLQLAALALYPASGGRAQLKNSPFGASFCAPIGSSPQPGGPELCRRAAFGYVYSSEIREGGWAKGRPGAIVSSSVDALGRPIGSLDLGWLFAPLFALWRMAFERVGARSPGRALAGERLVDAGGGRVAGERLIQRYAALIGPFLILSLLASAATLAGAASWAVASAASFGMLAFYGFAALDALRGRRPLHDRLAGTQVVVAPASRSDET
jgi:uncharacterized RDD family membrane protein YckC